MLKKFAENSGVEVDFNIFENNSHGF